MLGLIEDHHGVAPGCKFPQEVGIEAVHIALAGGLTGLQPELVGDGLQQLQGGEIGVKDQGCGDGFVEAFEQSPTQHGFARPDFAGNGDKAFALVNAVEQMSQGFFMGRAKKQKARIRGEIKGRFAQIEKR